MNTPVLPMASLMIDCPAPVDHGNLIGRLDRLPVGRFHSRIRGTVGFATFIDAVDFVAIGLALPVLVGKWNLTPQQAGLLISSSFLGQLIGALTFPALAQKFGRIPILAITVFWFGLAGVGCALSWSYPTLFIMRFLQGVGMGPEPPIAAAYVTEIAPVRQRGRFTLLYQLIFGFGLVAAGGFGRYLIPAFGWQSIFWIGAVPALIIAPLIYFLPESPRWLISKGRLDEANAVISAIEERMVAQGKALPPVIELPSQARLSLASRDIAKASWKELFSVHYGRRTILIWSVWISIGFISWPLTTWLPTIYTMVFHVSTSQALNYSLSNNITILCSLLTCALLIDPLGRKRYFVIAFSVAALALFALFLGHDNIDLLYVFSSICLFAITSLTLAIYVYTTELYPTRLRATGIGICNAWSRIAAIIAPGVIGFGLQNGGLGSVFLLLGVIAAFAAALVVFMGVETSRRILEDVSP